MPFAKRDVAPAIEIAVAVILREVDAPTVAHLFTTGACQRWALDGAVPGVSGRLLVRRRINRLERFLQRLQLNLDGRILARLDDDVLAVEGLHVGRVDENAVRARVHLERERAAGTCARGLAFGRDLIDRHHRDTGDGRFRLIAHCAGEPSVLRRGRGRRAAEQQQTEDKRSVCVRVALKWHAGHVEPQLKFCGSRACSRTTDLPKFREF